MQRTKENPEEKEEAIRRGWSESGQSARGSRDKRFLKWEAGNPISADKTQCNADVEGCQGKLSEESRFRKYFSRV